MRETPSERDAIKRVIKSLKKKMSKKESMKMLVKAGIYTPTGRLRKPYR